jgi:hypothetical protein
MKNGFVDIRILSDGDRTVVEAALHTYKYPSVVGTGSAGREPGDKADPKIGEALAVARALRSIAGGLERQAHGTMKHREDNKKHKLEIAESNAHLLIGHTYAERHPEWEAVKK